VLVGRISGRFWADQLRPVVESRRGLDAICASVDVYMQELAVREEHIRALYVLMGEALGPVAEVRPIFADLDDGFRAAVQEWLSQGIAAREIRADVEVVATAALVVASLRGAAMQWLMAPGCFDLDSVRTTLKTALCRSLAP